MLFNVRLVVAVLALVSTATAAAGSTIAPGGASVTVTNSGPSDGSDPASMELLLTLKSREQALTLEIDAPPSTYSGMQPWDFEKCQRGRCQWPERALPQGEVLEACALGDGRGDPGRATVGDRVAAERHLLQRAAVVGADHVRDDPRALWPDAAAVEPE